MVHPELTAQSQENGYQLRYQQWTVGNGLPDWKIYSYLQDENGLLWLSTQEGIYTFDGVAFRQVLEPNRSNKGGYVKSVLQDKNGMIWLLREMPSSVEVEILNPRTSKCYGIPKPSRIFWSRNSSCSGQSIPYPGT